MVPYKALCILSLIFLGIPSFAAPIYPMITGLKGEAKVLVKTAEGLPSLLYEGERFFYRTGKIGETLQEGNVVICDSACRVKLVYPSGTTLYVAPGTAFRVVRMEADSKGESSLLDLFYGRLRALVSKKRTADFKVKTAAVISGVRGTDFMISAIASQGSQIVVLSGVVDADPVRPEEKSVTLKSQQTLTETGTGEFALSPATKPQVLSAFETTAVPAAENPAEPAVKAEAQSKAVLIEELKIAQPQVYKILSDPAQMGVTDLNRKLIEQPLKKAKPSAGGMTESFNRDLENYKKVDEEK
jgi:hypothetical protein